MAEILLKRGAKADIPASAKLGEALVATDTRELFIGTGTGKVQITDVVFSGSAPGVHDYKKLWVDTTNNAIKFHDGSVWTALTPDLSGYLVKQAANQTITGNVRIENAWGSGMFRANGSGDAGTVALYSQYGTSDQEQGSTPAVTVVKSGVSVTPLDLVANDGSTVATAEFTAAKTSFTNAPVEIGSDVTVKAGADFTMETGAGVFDVKATSATFESAVTAAAATVDTQLATLGQAKAQATGVTLQKAYDQSAGPIAGIKLVTGKDFRITDDTDDNIYFQVDAETGAVKMTGPVNIEGDLNISGATTQIDSVVTNHDHLLLAPAGSAAALAVNPDTAFTGPTVVDIKGVKDGASVIKVKPDETLEIGGAAVTINAPSTFKADGVYEGAGLRVQGAKLEVDAMADGRYGIIRADANRTQLSVATSSTLDGVIDGSESAIYITPDLTGTNGGATVSVHQKLSIQANAKVTDGNDFTAGTGGGTVNLGQTLIKTTEEAKEFFIVGQTPNMDCGQFKVMSGTIANPEIAGIDLIAVLPGNDTDAVIHVGYGLSTSPENVDREVHAKFQGPVTFGNKAIYGITDAVDADQPVNLGQLQSYVATIDGGSF